jgi:putative addiction module antidote
MRVKLRRTGNSLSTTWPKDMLVRMNVAEGDELYLVETQDSVLVTPYDPRIEKALAAARRIMARDRHAFKDLARR